VTAPTVDPGHAWIRDLRAHPLTHQFHTLANYHRSEATRLQSTVDLDLRLSYATLIAWHDGKAEAYEVAQHMAAGQ
jgi:hypothetical protein